MTPPRSGKVSLALLRQLLALTIVVPQTQGADGSWRGPGSGSWEDSTNWAGDGIATGPGATGNFTAVDLTGNITITLDGPKSIGGLSFGDAQPSHDWFLRTGTGGQLKLEPGSEAPFVEVANRTATLGLTIEGTAGMIKKGQGTLVLSGANVYSGPTRILQGTVRLGCPPVFPQAMQIMPLGDSITYGYNGFNAGYRGPLYYLLNPSAPGFRYIGTSLERPGLLPSFPIDQRYNEGHSSYNIQDISNNLDGFDNARFLQYGGKERNPNGGYWLTGGNGTNRMPMFPNAITLMIGTNDLGNQPGVDERLRALIAKITTLRPDAHLFLAKITPAPDHPAVDSYNSIVEKVAAEFTEGGKKVHLVDLNTNFPANGLDPDHVHPNDIGFTWMATQWYGAILDAYTPAAAVTTGIPAASQVTLASNATLDLADNRSTVASFTSQGRLELGSQGSLSATSISLGSSASVGGSGTLHGNVMYNGARFGDPGESITIEGTLANNGIVESDGAALSLDGTFINNGTVAVDGRQLIAFGDTIINNGVMRLTGNVAFPPNVLLVNNGVLDVITGPSAMPAGLVNHGVILDATEVVTRSTEVSASEVILTIASHTGHLYQLQSSPDLEGGGWEDLGEPAEGETGTILELSSPKNPEMTRCFYRIKVFP